MFEIDTKYLSGSIYRKPSEDKFKHFLEKVSNIKIVGLIKSLKWGYGYLFSEKPLLQSDVSQLNQYSYTIVFRESKIQDIAILLTQNREISSYLYNECTKVDKNFYPVKINIENILKKIKEPDNKYLATFIHARVTGMLHNLNAISLYGKDTINSPVYSNYENNFESVSCGIGIADNSFTGYSEIIRLSSEGNISFHFQNNNTFVKIDSILNFIYDYIRS